MCAAAARRHLRIPCCSRHLVVKQHLQGGTLGHQHVAAIWKTEECVTGANLFGGSLRYALDALQNRKRGCASPRQTQECGTVNPGGGSKGSDDCRWRDIRTESDSPTPRCHTPDCGGCMKSDAGLDPW